MSQTKRHILLINVFFAPYSYGGATIVAEQVAQALLARGDYRITVVSLCTRAELQTYTIIKSERDSIVNYVINVPPGRSYTQMYNNPTLEGMIADLMADLSPDLLHVHCLQDVGAGVLQVAHDAGVPSILSVHDFWWLCERQFMIRMDQSYCGQDPINIENCRNCVADFDQAKARFEHLNTLGNLPAKVTYPSQFARDLSVASGFAPGTSVVWENGVRLPEPGFFDAQSARRDADPRLVFGFVGGPSQIKGWPLIKEAFASLNRDDFKVIVVDGSLDGSWWSGQNLDDLPGEWSVHPRFEQPQMDVFYSKIDVLLFMSQWKETFGLAIRESLARGIGVMQTDSGGTTEHPAAQAERLIPIGADAAALKAQIEAALAQHPDFAPVHPVASYADQAAALDALITEVLPQPER